MPDSIEAVNVKVEQPDIPPFPGGWAYAFPFLHDGKWMWCISGSTSEAMARHSLISKYDPKLFHLSDRPREMRVRIVGSGIAWLWLDCELQVMGMLSDSRDEALSDAARFAASIGHVLKVEE